MVRTVIARWESSRGKDWVEVYQDQHGFGYEANGSCGWFGNVTREEALQQIEHRVALRVFCSQKTPMKRVV
jgi:hypothetical protein